MTEAINLSRLSHFRITCPDGSDFSDRLYANGRHQSEIVVEIVKECQNKAGVWEYTKLTDEEVASVRVAPFFSEDGKSLPSGWSCDERKNAYSEGLWERDKGVETKADHYNPGSLVQRVSRYLRFSSQGAMDSVRFVAYMILNSQVYTTKVSAEDSGFSSSVTLQPVAPFRLWVKDLVEYIHHAVSASDFYATVYYWTPPAGVVFVAQQGLDRPLDMQYEGDHFQTSYAYAKEGNYSTHKGGVVVDKDNSTVMREDIFKSYGPPVYNYPVWTNIRPTIMRAITAKSIALKIDVTRDSNSPWSLMDNFGNIHRFCLVPNGAGGGLHLEDYEFRPETHITDFKIIFPDGLPTSNALYANGRHQCKVLIEGTKEEQTEDGNWRAVPLTLAERDSATVTLYSVNDDQALPSGWSCDMSKNIYDTGLWVRGSEKNDPEKLVGVDYAGPGPLVETIDRYMRVDPSRPIESMRFMARIVVGGTVYTTYKTQGGAYVTLTPTRPYTVKAAELTAFPDLNAYSDGTADCDVYYWLLPSPLRFLVNKGLDRPLPVANEGVSFATSWSRSYSSTETRYCKAGILIAKDGPEYRIRMRDVHRNIYSGGDGANPYIPFSKHNTMMRAVRLMAKTTFTTGNTNTPWRLWDNYGCEHVYRLDTEGNGAYIVLKDF
jgi:hypothetical protein